MKFARIGYGDDSVTAIEADGSADFQVFMSGHDGTPILMYREVGRSSMDDWGKCTSVGVRCKCGAAK
jgi:hypothetical protein